MNCLCSEHAHNQYQVQGALQTSDFRLILPTPLHLAVPKTKEQEVVLGVSLDPFGSKGLNHIGVHDLHSSPLPVQDSLN